MPNRNNFPFRRGLPILLGSLLLVAALLIAWQPAKHLLGDLPRLQAWVAGLGAWGPVALIALGVVQVLVAPLPGYPIVFVSGVLFGGWWGALYANVGILLAGMLAAALSRAWGRPLVARFVEAAHMKRLEGLLASDSVWLWFLVLLLPTGDLPYFAAGLSRIPLSRFLVALAAARLPFTFVLTHAAARAVTLPAGWLLLLLVPIAALAALAYWQQARLQAAVQRLLARLSAPVPGEG